ncbi:MAG: hypothetical protein LUG19_02750 [Desulfovibrio sp.]|nr:amidohydrolase family protein [Desulfovibrio sp.]MCD7983159.1 hypothetical protein [Desulfovibrio sp.]
MPSLADALCMLKVQAECTPAPQWVRVVGGWSAFQFAERRMPILDEINTAAPEMEGELQVVLRLLAASSDVFCCSRTGVRSAQKAPSSLSAPKNLIF